MSLPVVVCGLVWPSVASAHVSEQGFVLLLPTGVYISAGVAVVALTVAATLAMPERIVRTLFGWRPLVPAGMERTRQVMSLVSLAVFGFLVWIGLEGPRNPLENLLPLLFWTVWWVAVIPLAAVFGNLWQWINPWTGLHRLLGAPQLVKSFPEWVGLWPAVALLIAFGLFLLADLAPDDPARLAWVLAIYWMVTVAGLVVFGARWLDHAELGHAIFATYARLSALRLTAPSGLGLPGWQLAAMPAGRAAGAFALTLLALGSFDGLNETFWWLGRIGVNPLEFPGRSAVVAENAGGFVGMVALLFAIFAAVVWLGIAASRAGTGFARTFNLFATSLIPIALAYHMAHYLTSFLVNIQYALAALSDPLDTGANLLRLDRFHVTTGFFNRIDTVRLIWLAQAGIIVFGHVWSVLLGHRLALEVMPPRRAMLATLPLALLMVGYTFLGLWLLATPRGV